MKTTIAEQCNLTEEGIRETIFGKPGEKDAENQVALNAALEKYSLPGITLKQILNALDSDAPVSGWTFMRTVLQHPNLSRLYHRINPLSSTVVEALLPKTRATLNSKKVITEDPDSGIFFTDQVVPALDSILQENTELS